MLKKARSDEKEYPHIGGQMDEWENAKIRGIFAEKEDKMKAQRYRRERSSGLVVQRLEVHNDMLKKYLR